VGFKDANKFYKYAKDKMPSNEDEASDRYKEYKSIDPFPDIPDALLNSADIFKYIVATGMIYPFDPHPDKFRGATYAVSLKGQCIYWDEDGKEVIEYIENENETIKLKPNSITFVTLEPTFRVPEYMALRFNLKIGHVYKGLLLGTGPIVDPGFVGKLSIPLHNLTLNTYELKFNEELIWVEFTKLSQNEKWHKIYEHSSTLRNLKSYYIPFPTQDKSNRTIFHYIEKALKGSIYIEKKDDCKNSIPDYNVRNAIPTKVKEIEKDAIVATKSAQNAEAKITRISLLGIFAIAVSIFSVYSLVQDSINYVTDAKEKYNTKIQEFKSENDKDLKQIQEEIQKVKQENESYKSKLEKMESDLKYLNDKNISNEVSNSGNHGNR
jgi:deoxycytidine triphosphate deaminase